MSKKYNQELTEKDIIKLFESHEIVSKKLVCDYYNTTRYRVNMTLENMNLKITNYGFKLK